MKNYLSIIKPGIIFGNIVTVSGGFFLASHQHFNFSLFLITLVGMSLVIACGCVFNNYIDRDIDSLMERTQNRVMVKGLISGKVAILYAIVLGIAGFLTLYYGTNLLTTIVAAVGLFVYVVAYTIMTKRHSNLGTLIGGIAGAVPPVVGYCAVTNRFDVGAIILFFILFFWQLPHFYAIAIFRLKDFSAACIPVLPIQKNIRYTKISMLVYVVAFTITAILPTVFGYAGWVYFIVALSLGLYWLYLSIKGFKSVDDQKWSRQMFGFSILAITILSMVMAVRF
ncbi:MAG: protoheme farnesyltransferase [Gammaproteobacteria bacterium]|jgi:protoheme IX farnesyltransferase|nr:protoheme farnesyltransferase [Gammaproteobacteria bacterium]